MSSEVKRYEIGGPDWEMDESPIGEWVAWDDYAALEAENARLREISDGKDESLMQLDALWRSVSAERDALRTQLEAIRAAGGEEVEVVGFRSGTSGMIYETAYGLERPLALMTVAQHQRITAAMAAEVERLKHAAAGELVERLAAQLIESGAENYQESHFELEFDASGEKCLAVVTLQRPDKPSPHELRAKAEQERDALRAELAEVKGREGETCEHDWFDASNARVSNCLMCSKCHAIKPAQHPTNGADKGDK